MNVETREYATISLQLMSATLDVEGTKTVNCNVIECRLVKVHAQLWQVGHLLCAYTRK